MEIALYVLAVYAILAVISRIFAEHRKKKMLRLQAKTVELSVGETVIPKDEWDKFNKDDHQGEIIKYVIEYDHPMDTENKTQYTTYEIIALKANRFIEKVSLPLHEPFEILVNAQKPQKVELGRELAFKKKTNSRREKDKQSGFKDQLNARLKTLEEKKANSEK